MVFIDFEILRNFSMLWLFSAEYHQKNTFQTRYLRQHQSQFSKADNHLHKYNISSTVQVSHGYFRNESNLGLYGKLIDVKEDSLMMQAFHTFHGMKRKRFGTDNEDFDAVEKYFWGMREGLVMEIGALNGVKHSNSLALRKHFDWHRILVEANPFYANMMKTDSPDAIGFGAALCKEEKVVHYVEGSTTGGIVEFMSPNFINDWHKYLINTTASDWARNPKITQISCIPLHLILCEAQVSHINLFILDTEGSELSILETIHFNEVKFDVIVVEVESKNRPGGEAYQDSITSFLRTFNYSLNWTKGRNAWYVHHDFKPSSFAEPKAVPAMNTNSSHPTAG